MGERLNLSFPLWIDGGLSKDLHAGARAMRDYLSPRFAWEDVPVDECCSPALERGIVGYEAICAHLNRAREILSAKAPARILAIGGGCGIEIPIVSYLRRLYRRIRLLWFDAHGDINSPESSPSKYFHGMPLRFLLEPGLDEGIGGPDTAIESADVVLIGARDLDPPEDAYIRERGIRVVDAKDAAAARLDSGAAPIHIHLDLDVLDPSEYPNVKCPASGGFRIDELARVIGALMHDGRVVGMSIVENLATDEATLSRLEPIFESAAKL